MIPDKLFTFLKWLALIALPAISLLVNGLGQVWGWQYTEQITLTISIIATCLGSLLGVSAIATNVKMKKLNSESESE